MAKGLAKIVSWGGYFPGAVREIYLADRRRPWARAVPVALVAGLYLFLAAGWG